MARKKKTEKITWDKSKAKQTIVQDMLDGLVPIEERILDAAKLCDEFYAGMEDFKDFPYDSKFANRIKNCQDQVVRHEKWAKYDADALSRAREIYPKPTHYPTGKPLWRGSYADAMLEQDLREGKLKKGKPKDLFLSRDCYKPFGLERFRKRIDQKKQDAKEYALTPNQLLQDPETRRNKYYNGRPVGREESRKHMLDCFENVVDFDTDLGSQCEAILKKGGRCTIRGNAVIDGLCGRHRKAKNVKRVPAVAQTESR